MLLLALACAGGGSDGPTRAPDPEPSGSTPPPAVSASCAVDPYNVLRWTCAVHVTPPSAVEISYQDAAGVQPVRVAVGDRVRETQDVTLLFLTPETAYTFDAHPVGADGQFVGGFTTGVLPASAQVTLTTLDGRTSAPMIGMASPCQEGSTVVILDPVTGRPLWYQELLSSFGFLDAVSFTEDRTVLAVLDSTIDEVDLYGHGLLHLIPGMAFEHRVHHDVFRKDGLTWALFQETVTESDGDYLLDGFYVLDASGAELAEWHLADGFVPPPGPPHEYPLDTSHANAIWVDDDHQVTLSMRHLSAVARIEGDPASPEFGVVRDRIANPTSAYGSDYAFASEVVGPADFEWQHNVFGLPDGHLTLLDNRVDPTEHSRVIELALDPDAGVATIVKSWTLPEHCDYQGGAWRTPAGHPLATCASSRTGYEYDPDSGAELWRGTVTCDSGFPTYVPRFVPLDWGPGVP